MKRILLSIVLLFALVSVAHSTVWYAQGTTPTFSTQDGSHVSSVWNDAANGSGNWLDWDTGPATNDTFSANGVAGIVVDIDPKGTAGATKVVLNTDAGGGFVITSAGTYTVTADIGVSGNTGTTDVLTVGSGANVITFTLLGNIYGGGTANADGLVIAGSGVTATIGSVGSPVTITGGSASACNGLNDTHTATTTTVYATVTGGTNGSAYGIQNGGGALALTGNVTAGNGGHGLVSIAGGAITVTGDCTAHATASAVGCSGQSTGAVTITGSMTAGLRQLGAVGKIVWAPSSADKYVSFNGGGTAVYAGIAPGCTVGPLSCASAAGKIATGTSFIDATDGSYDAGSATAGGGGAWGF